MPSRAALLLPGCLQTESASNDQENYTTPIRPVTVEGTEDRRGEDKPVAMPQHPRHAQHPQQPVDFSVDMMPPFVESSSLSTVALPTSVPPSMLPTVEHTAPSFPLHPRPDAYHGSDLRRPGVHRIVVGGRSFPSNQFDEADDVSGFLSVGPGPTSQFSGKFSAPFASAPSGSRLVLQVSGGTVTSVTRMGQYDSSADDTRRGLQEGPARDLDAPFDLFAHDDKDVLDVMDTSATMDTQRITPFMPDRHRSHFLSDRSMQDDIGEDAELSMIDDKAIDGWLSEGSVESGASAPSSTATPEARATR